ncbi:hypothetical protein LB505_007703 [Fusarium chuoi]|nr:hypothetical protein LB505_007703 [Fusarium chuoi]
MEYHVQTIFMQPAQIEGDVLPPEVGSAIEALWKDRGVQECFKRSRDPINVRRRWSKIRAKEVDSLLRERHHHSFPGRHLRVRSAPIRG